MRSTYNNYIENAFKDYLINFYQVHLNKHDFRITNVEVTFENESISHFIDRGLTHEYVMEFFYFDNKERRKSFVIRLPRLINNSFIIDGKIRVPVFVVSHNYEIRAFSVSNFNIDYHRRVKYDNTGNFLMIRNDDWQWEEIPFEEVNDLPLESRTLNEEQSTRLCIKLGIPTEDIILDDVILSAIRNKFKGNVDKYDDFIIDKKIITVQESLRMHINKNRPNLYRMLNSKIRRYGNIYPTDMQKVINSFFKMRSDSFVSIQNPSSINSLNFESLGRRVIMNTSGPNTTHYNLSMVDLIDPIRTPENINVNRINELNYSTEVNEDGTSNIRVYDRDFEEVSIPYYKYYDSYIVSNQDVNYIRKTINKGTIEVKHRGKLLKIKYSDLANMNNVFIDAKADDKLSPSTRVIPMINRTDSVRVGMGANMVNQAIELVNAEPPLINSVKMDESNPLNILANKSGEVVSVEEDYVRVKNEDGTTSEYTYPPISSLFDIHINRASKLKVGDRIEKNEVVAKSPIIDQGYNLGVNCKVALMGYGNTFEDGFIISEAIQDKFAHISIIDLVHVVTSRDKLLGMASVGDEVEFSDKLVYTESILDTNRGMNTIKKITPLNSLYIDSSLTVPNNAMNAVVSDIVVLEGNQPEITSEKEIINKALRDRKRIDNPLLKNYINKKLDRSSNMSKEGYKYLIKIKLLVINRLEVGSKISNRWGSKGLVAEVLPEDKMPYNELGERVEMIINPLTSLGRKIVSQLHEVNLTNITFRLWNHIEGLIHEKDNYLICRGMLSEVVDPELELLDYSELLDYHKKSNGKYRIYTGAYSFNINEKVTKYLELFGLSPEGEVMYDGFTKRKIMNPILTGHMYMMKLYHMADYKNKVNVTYNPKHDVVGSSYRDTGLKMGEMEMYALYASNMDNFIDSIRASTDSLDKTMILTDLLLLGYDISSEESERKSDTSKLEKLRDKYRR